MQNPSAGRRETMGFVTLAVIYQVCPEGSYLQTVTEVKLFLPDST